MNNFCDPESKQRQMQPTVPVSVYTRPLKLKTKQSKKLIAI